MATKMIKQAALGGGKSRLVRSFTIENLTHRNIITALDDGCSPDGKPNQQRQHLENTLSQFVAVEHDGERLRLPLWRIVEMPPAWPATSNEKQATAYAQDQRPGGWEDRWLRDDTGKPRTATPAWRAVQVALCAGKDERRAELVEQAERAKGREVVEAIQGMIEISKQPRTRAITPREARASAGA